MIRNFISAPQPSQPSSAFKKTTDLKTFDAEFDCRLIPGTIDIKSPKLRENGYSFGFIKLAEYTNQDPNAPIQRIVLSRRQDHKFMTFIQNVNPEQDRCSVTDSPDGFDKHNWLETPEYVPGLKESICRDITASFQDSNHYFRATQVEIAPFNRAIYERINQDALRSDNEIATRDSRKKSVVETTAEREARAQLYAYNNMIRYFAQANKKPTPAAIGHADGIIKNMSLTTHNASTTQTAADSPSTTFSLKFGFG